MPVRRVAGPVLGEPLPGRDGPIYVETKGSVDFVVVEEFRIGPERVFVPADGVPQVCKHLLQVVCDE